MLLENLTTEIDNTLIELRAIAARAESIDFSGVGVRLETQIVYSTFGFNRLGAELPAKSKFVSALLLYDDDQIQYTDRIKFISIQETPYSVIVFIYPKSPLTENQRLRAEIKYLTTN